MEGQNERDIMLLYNKLFMNEQRIRESLQLRQFQLRKGQAAYRFINCCK